MESGTNSATMSTPATITTGDMAKMAAEPRNQAWLKVTDAMQIPLKGEKTWATMNQVYYNP